MVKFEFFDFDATLERVKQKKHLPTNGAVLSSMDKEQVGRAVFALCRTNIDLIFFCPPGQNLNDFLSTVLDGSESRATYTWEHLYHPDRISYAHYRTTYYWWLFYILMRNEILSNEVPVPHASNVQRYMANYLN